MTKPRSLKKGESPTWEVGRKATGLKRNKALTIRFTEDELKIINETLERFKGSKSDSLLKIINKIKKIIEEEVQNMNKIKKYMQKYNIMPSENKSNDTLVGLEYLIIKSQEYPSIWLRITEEYIALSFMDASNEVVKLWEVMKKKLGFENKENIQTYYLDIFFKKYHYDSYKKEIDEMLNEIKKFILNDEEYSKVYKILF